MPSFEIINNAQLAGKVSLLKYHSSLSVPVKAKGNKGIFNILRRLFSFCKLLSSQHPAIPTRLKVSPHPREI
jgi:hypothetical protein